MSRPIAKLTVPFATVSILAALVAAVPGMLLGPGENDGQAQFFSLFFIPMTASAIMIAFGAAALERRQTIRKRVLWWPLGVMPVGILLGMIPPVLRDREYFLAESFWGTVGTLTMMFLLIYVGILLGMLLWFFVVFPIVLIAGQVRRKLQGKKVPLKSMVMPLLLIALGAIILVGAASLDDLAPGRAAGGQIVMALLGIPGNYDVTWPLGLWIVRAFIAALLLWWFLSSRRESRRESKRAKESRTSSR